MPSEFFEFMRVFWTCLPNIVHILIYIVFGMFAVFALFRIIKL